MCNHTKLTFIGYQENPSGDPIPLFNCLECHTTISLKKHMAKLDGRYSLMSDRDLPKRRPHLV